MSVVNPAVATYASRSPYITADEYQNAPTGVDWGNLIPGGSTAQNLDALVQTIARASSWVDNACQKVLAATLDTQTGNYRVCDDAVRISLDYTPIVSVESISVGPSPSTVAQLTSLTDVWIGKKAITVPLWGMPYTPYGRMYAVVSYVNGYVNTTLTATASATYNTITVASVLAVQPNQQLTVFDGANTETITVLSVSGNVLTLSAPLQYAHSAGVMVSNLPPAIKQATILLTSALIKTRGDDAYTMSSYTAAPSGAQKMDGSGSEDEYLALELLAPYRRVA